MLIRLIVLTFAERGGLLEILLLVDFLIALAISAQQCDAARDLILVLHAGSVIDSYRVSFYAQLVREKLLRIAINTSYLTHFVLIHIRLCLLLEAFMVDWRHAKLFGMVQIEHGRV